MQYQVCRHVVQSGASVRYCRHSSCTIITGTRMHSSRMRTGHSLTVCRSQGGCLLWGVSTLGGVCSQGSVCSGGRVSALGGWHPSMHCGRHPPVNRMTNRCKNITLATTSLRPVISEWLLKKRNTNFNGFFFVYLS